MATTNTTPTLTRKAESPQPTQPSRPAMPMRLLERDIGLLETKQASWQARLRPEHSLESALKPEFLGHRCAGMRARDRVHFEHPDWTLEAIVVRVDPELRLVYLVPLPGYPLDLKGAQLAAADFSLAVVEQTADGTWRVRIAHDIAVADLPSEAAASKWLADRTARAIE